MLSRVADSLFWMSRYLERAEHTARVIHVHRNLDLEQTASGNEGRWARVLTTLNQSPELARELSTHSLVEDLCFNTGNRFSILTSLRGARDNARQVREQISSEMWEQLNRLFHETRSGNGAGDARTDDEMEFLSEVRDGAHLFQGLTDSTMSHGEGWHFIQLGRFLERAAGLATLLSVHFNHFFGPAALRPEAGPEAADYLEWIGLLRCATAFEAYCKVYTAAVEPSRVAEFLVLNETFPHSIRFAADMVDAALARVADASPSRRGTRAQRLAGRWKASLSFTHIEEVMASGIPATMADQIRQCAAIHSGIDQAFITYSIEAALEA